MDTARTVRHGVKRILGVTALIAVGFLLLHAARPDIAARLSGQEYDENDPKQSTLLTKLFGKKDDTGHFKKSSLPEVNIFSDTGRSNKSLAGNSGTLRHEYGAMAFGTPGSQNHYVPYQFQTPTKRPKAALRKQKHLKVAAKLQTRPAPSPRRPASYSQAARIEPAAPVPPAAEQTQYRRAAEVPTIANDQQNSVLPQVLSKVSSKIGMSGKVKEMLEDDTIVVLSLLNKADQDLRLAPSAIAAAERFLKLHVATAEAKKIRQRLDRFRHRHSEEMLQRSALDKNEPIEALKLDVQTAQLIRSCLGRDRRIVSLAAVRKVGLSGLPAIFVAARFTLISGNSAEEHVASCLAPLFQRGTVAVLAGRLGKEGAAVSRIMAVKNSRIYWTGFAGLSTVTTLQ
jgi:hypothetical protein